VPIARLIEIEIRLEQGCGKGEPLQVPVVEIVYRDIQRVNLREREAALGKRHGDAPALPEQPIRIAVSKQ
jgi:hypothetical protein